MTRDKRTGIQRIADERRRQLGALGWSEDHDDEHTDASLAWAAVCYAAPSAIFVQETSKSGNVRFFDPFPWGNHADARQRPPKGHVAKAAQYNAHRLRLLEKAGALIAAEIDRLLREGESR